MLVCYVLRTSTQLSTFRQRLLVYLHVQWVKETSIKVSSKRRRKLESSHRSYRIVDHFPGLGEGRYESGKRRDRTNEQKHIQDGNKIEKKRKSKKKMCVSVIYWCFSMLTFGVSNRAVCRVSRNSIL